MKANAVNSNEVIGFHSLHLLAKFFGSKTTLRIYLRDIFYPDESNSTVWSVEYDFLNYIKLEYASINNFQYSK